MSENDRKDAPDGPGGSLSADNGGGADLPPVHRTGAGEAVVGGGADTGGATRPIDDIERPATSDTVVDRPVDADGGGDRDDAATGDEDGGGDRSAERTGGQEKRIGRRPEGPEYDRDSGFGATLKRTVLEFKEDRGTDLAAGLTYYAVLSIFPMLIAFISIVGLVGDPKKVTSNLVDIVNKFGPSTTAKTFEGPISDITANRGSAGILLVVGIVGALWTASAYVGGFFRASNVLYEVEEGRSFFKLRPLQMLVTLLQVLVLTVVAMALVVTGPVAKKVGSGLGIGDTAVTVWDIAKWPVMAALVLLAIAILYFASPNAKLRSFGSVFPGALLALVIWLVASVGFAFYVTNFGSYNKTYGALGGVITFLIWIWLTNVAVVLGAEFNAERERSKQFEDGERGAEREIQVAQRDEPKDTQRSRTA